MHRRLGQILLYAGTAVCALGAVGLVLGMTLTIPEALAWKIVRAVAYAAPLLVGGTLMGCGALLLRASRADRAGGRRDAAVAGQVRPALAAPAGEGPPAPVAARERAGVERSARAT